MSQTATRQRKRNLVIVRAGDGSLHESWDGPERDFDVAVSYFGDRPDPYPAADYVVHQKGSKWEGLSATLAGDDIPWREYDFIMLPDDDLLSTPAEINRFFEIVTRERPPLSQPSLMSGSYYTHQVTVQQAGSEYRTTTMVEIMAPCFRRDFLEEMLPTLGEKQIGLGSGLPLGRGGSGSW